MSSQFPPLDCKKVKKILKHLGFVRRDQKNTSHEQWVKDTPNGRLKVTVDCPKAPFSPDLISSMAKQSGISKKNFYKISRKV